MKALLSVVFDMSLTASWVILAVLVIRFLLRKAPRKYAYVLWSVVAFRLCCPVSFSSVFSLFSLPLLSPVLRQTETVSQITQTPVQVIPTAPVTPMSPTAPIRPQLPAVTPGLPAVTQPAVTPAADPADLWLTTATVLWCAGMAVLLIYTAVSYLRLRRQLATAIRLEGNVWRSENIRSPFILSFLRPKIYIPYGLDDASLGYVLAHERTHLRRLDHIVKPLSFLLLTLHWFNPLVWLSFFLMSRDMEMSCDEAVLAGADNIRKSYSTTLLSFAANRRFPVPSPLAFGETGVKSRIRNVLRWKRPAAWVTVTAVLVCAVVLIACAADPETPADSTPDNAPAQSTAPDVSSLPAPAPTPAEGKYLSAQCLYLSPYSSQTYTGDSGYRYQITDSGMVIVLRTSGEVSAISPTEWGWKDFPWTNAEWTGLFMDSPVSTPPEINGYTERLYQPLGEEYCLLKMDGVLWLMKTSAKTGDVWSIYALKQEAQNGSVQWEYTPYFSSRYPAFAFVMELPAGWHASAYCAQARLSARTDTSGSALQQQSVELSDGDLLYWHPASPIDDGDDIHLTVQSPDDQFMEATLCIELTSQDSSKTLYTATLTGTDFVLYREENGWYATLALAERTEGPEAPAAPDTGEDAQLQLIADSVEEWAVHFDYADDRVGYAVTDLDGNGRLEVIAAQQGGTGNYTYASYYEVNDTYTALEKLRYNVPEGDSQPDIMEDGTIMVFYNPNTGSYTWIFQDFLRATAAEYYRVVYGLTSMNGEITTEALATEEKLYTDTGYTEHHTDSNGNPLTKTEFNLIPMTAYHSSTRYYGILQWLRFDRDNSILELDSTTLLHQLTESMQSFQLAKYP